MKSLLLLLFALTLFVSACGEETVPELVVEPNLDALVVENCAIVAEAVEVYMADHDWYPTSVSEFLSLLPNGELLVNPYTGLATEPTDGWAESQGQTGYRPTNLGSGWIPGCHITGFGDSEVIRHLVEPHDFDALVIANCHIVADAAEMYKSLYGSYPQENIQLKPLLPDGEWLINPYTMFADLPLGSPAANPGDTGYLSIPDGSGEFVGYHITGGGESGPFYEIHYYPTVP